MRRAPPARPTPSTSHPAAARPARGPPRAAASPLPPPPVPSSREAAVAQAATSLDASLTVGGRGRGGGASPRKGKKKGKAAPSGFTPAAAARITLEIPVADDSPSATAALAADVLACLPPSVAASAHLCFGDVDAALAASDLLPATPVTALDGAGEGEAEQPPPGAWLLLAAPPASSPSLAPLLAAWRSRDVAALNPGWAGDARGWRAAYAFQPIAVAALLSSTPGAILAARAPGGPPDPTWFIYKQERGGGGLMGVGGGDPTFAVVGRSQKRPTVADLEDAFYNASAAASPVTKGVAALKGLVDRARGKE